MTIVDDDQPPPPSVLPTLSIDDVEFPEENADSPRTVIVRLSAPATDPVRVLIGARPEGTATKGSNCAADRDFAFTFRTVTINPGQTSLGVPFTLCGDTTLEPDETFAVGLTNPVNAVLGDSVGQHTILNDDTVAPLTVSILDASFDEGTASSTQVVAVRLSDTATDPVTVLIGARPGGTATKASGCAARPMATSSSGDFAFPFRTVTINPGQRGLDFQFTLCGDTVFEPEETFAVGLTTPVNAVLGDSIGEVTIRDDDGAPNLQMSIDNAARFLTQETPSLVYVITLINSGAGGASNVQVQALLPLNVAFVEVGASEFDGCLGNTTDASGAVQVNCTVSSLPAGSRRTVRIIARIIGDIPGAIQNGARVVFGVNADPLNTVGEQNEADNIGLLSTVVRTHTDLQIAKFEVDTLRIDRDRGTFASQYNDFDFQFQWTVKNEGPYTSSPTTLRIEWPAGAVRVFGDDGNDIPRPYEVSVPALEPSATFLVARTVKFRTLTNDPTMARVRATADPDGTNLDVNARNNRSTLSLLLR